MPTPQQDDAMPTDDMVQIIGVIRFSLPCIGGFKQKFDNVERQLNSLFNPSRMEKRFKYFEKLCLNTLRNQSDPRFRLVVVVGQDMPNDYMERLVAITRDITQIQILPLPIIEHRAAMQQAFESQMNPDIPFSFGFRLDDDDAVALNYIETLHQLAPRLLAVSDGKYPIAAAFPKGLSVFEKDQEKRIIAAKMNLPPSAGIAVLHTTDWDENVYRFPHNRIGTLLTTLYNPARFMYLRMIHDTNDAEHFTPTQRLSLTDGETDRLLRKQFAISAAELNAL